MRLRALRRVAVAVAVSVVAGCSDDAPEATEPSATAGPSNGTATTTSRSSTTATTGVGSTVVSVPPPALPQGPAWDRDFPDPFVLAGDHGHVAAATTSGLIQIQGLESPGLADWAGPVELLGTAPSWAVPLSTWAPALLQVDDGYFLYYTALVAGTDQHCIAVAWSATATGPYADVLDEPLLCPLDQGGAIDPSPFRDEDGALYLLWKNDGITLRQESAIWSQPLSADGRTLIGEPSRLIGTDQNWEYPHVEAPSMAFVDGAYWLAYSGNWWNQAAYGVGMASCASPSGPCEKPMDRPVLTSTPGRSGPGGAEFFRDRSGRLLVAYHAWLDEPGYPGHRALFLATVRFEAGAVTVTPV